MPMCGAVPRRGWSNPARAFNRYAYYLTPRGFAEKSRLTAEYLAASLDFFRRARRDCSVLLDACAVRGWRRIVLYGAGELAEIAALSATEKEIEIICVIDREAGARRCAGRPIMAIGLPRARLPAMTASLP